MYFWVHSARYIFFIMSKFIAGREDERAELTDIYNSISADMLAITGRRRVGKTYLVKAFFEKELSFEFSGILHATNEQHLQSFSIALAQKTKNKRITSLPKNWMDAFSKLSNYLDTLNPSKKIVVFLDELPWLDTPKSNFIAALDWFWNSWASTKNILLIICGSAASWMAKKVINNRGGLHNRVTKRIHLAPFTLSETAIFLNQKNIRFSPYHIVQLYMAMGGIPHYLKEVKKGQSAIQNINRICFEKKGLLVNEFDNLYNALFTNAKQHIQIIEALAAKQKGLTRKEILVTTKLKDGGTFTKLLNELEQSNFIAAYYPFGKLKKEVLYRLIDEYSLFYLRFMKNKKNVNWQQLAATPTYKTWSGYAFENICLKHIEQIKKGLGIASVYTEESSFYTKPSQYLQGTQIDLLIDRKDGIINICEAKFYDKPFSLTKSYAEELRKKMFIFQEKTKTKKTLFLTMFTAYGIIPNIHSIGFVQQEIKIDDLF
jgi:uncharacterized protein